MPDGMTKGCASAAVATAIAAAAAATAVGSVFVEAGMLESLPGTPVSTLISLREFSILFFTFLRVLVLS